MSSALTMADDPGARGKLQDPSVYSDCLLMVGICGVATLADTPLSDRSAMFKQSTSSSGGCGGGCGSGCGGGGGCGGGSAAVEAAAAAEGVEEWAGSAVASFSRR